ncbi:MAG: hypothetical protein Ct9H90mP5_04410 [Acidimicrobiaceae bacterium]|nr:MAG: hypothetical protein Ct9H90mP5_04410 [Acidimicrobiaceae bacterium]
MTQEQILKIANTTVDRLLTEDVDAIVGAAASGITGSVIDKITSAGITQCSPSNTAAGLGTSGDDGFYFSVPHRPMTCRLQHSLT